MCFRHWWLFFKFLKVGLFCPTLDQNKPLHSSRMVLSKCIWWARYPKWIENRTNIRLSGEHSLSNRTLVVHWRRKILFLSCKNLALTRLSLTVALNSFQVPWLLSQDRLMILIVTKGTFSLHLLLIQSDGFWTCYDLMSNVNVFFEYLLNSSLRHYCRPWTSFDLMPKWTYCSKPCMKFCDERSLWRIGNFHEKVKGRFFNLWPIKAALVDPWMPNFDWCTSALSELDIKMP